MTLRAHLLDAAVDGAPGESVEIQLAVLNDAEGPQTITATAIGVGGDLDDQPIAPPASITVAPMSRTRLSVPVVVPSSYGVGRHAIGIRVTGLVPTDTVLLTATISIASVRDVDLDPTPSPVRGRRRVSTQLDITNREAHPVDIRLGTDQSPANPVRARFKPDSFSLPPGGHAIAKVKLRGPRHWVGDRLQHNVRLTAVGRASQTGVNLPYVQKPLLAAKLRGLVAVVVVLALWLSLVVVGAWFINDRFLDDGGSTATEADASGDGTDGAGDGSGDGSGGAVDDTGDGSGGAVDDTGDGSGDGADGSTGDGPADDGTGGSGDGGTGDGPADDGTGGGSVPPVDDSIPDTESSTPAVVVRGTIDVDGADTADGVTIYPSKMLLADVADTTTAFATPSGVTDAQPRKIWSARYAPPSEPPRIAQTEPIPAGPFAPNAQGIWATELSANQAYELAFVRPGYQTQSFVVTPQVGSEIELDVTLEPAKGVIGGQVNAGGPRQNVAITVTDGFVDYQTATDQSGRWLIEGVPTDELYTVLASIEGFGAAARQDRVEPENPERLDLDLTLFQGQGVVTGSVIDAVLATQPGQEAGLGGVSVTAVDGDDERATTTLTTGSIGDFVLPDLTVGRTYTLRAELDGYAPATTQVTVTGAVTGSPTLSLMPLAATLTGVVTSESGGGAPVPLATIKVTSDSSPDPIAFVQSSSDTGEFTLGQVPPGRYQIVVDHFGHATERLDLVVEDSTSATLTPSMPGAPSQTGTRFSITMTPQDSTSVTLPTGSLALEIRDADENAECPRQPDGTLRPAAQCLAIFDATVHIRTTDPAVIPKSDDDPSPFQKVVDATGREHWEFVCASPAGVCDSGTNFPDYTIRGIPAGTYTVVTSHPEYNSSVRQVTVFPNQVNRETVPMVRLGTVRGTVVDSTNPDQSILGGNTVIVKVVSIDQNGNDLDEFRTAVIEGGFQTDDEVRLPVGRYRIDVQAQAAGYFVDDDKQDVDDNVNTVDGLEFEILPFIPGNPVTSLIELQPILADPYPELQVRTFQPATADPPTFETIGVDPIARVTCATNSTDNAPITVSSADAGGLTGLPAGTVGLSKVQVAQLDGAEVVGRLRDIGHGDGLLRDCSMIIEATGFEPVAYPFSGLTVLAADRDPLELAVDRYLDVAMLREPPAGTVRVPSGSLWWIDEGATGNQEVPIPGAQITSSSVIAQIVPSDSTTEPTDPNAAVALWQPTLSTTSVTNGTRATWDFPVVVDPNGDAITVEHVIGDAVFAVDGPDASLGEQFPGGTITLSTDIAGAQTLTVQTDPDITNDPNIADGRYDTRLEPNGGVIQGRVEILTADPTPLSYVDNFELTATMATRTHVVTPEADGTFDIPVHPGSWDVELTTITGHIFSDPLSGQTEPFVAPAENAPTLFRVVEDGGFTLTVNSTDADVPSTPIDYTLIDQATGTDHADPSYRIDELPVPTVFPANSNQKKYYILTIDSVGGLDPRNASVAIYRQFNDGSAAQLLTTYNGVNLTNGFRYPEGWQGGDDYEFRITLQPYGRVEGYISGFEGPGATPALVCPNGLPPAGTPVTLTAVPVTLVTTDPLLPPVPVLDTTSGRENIVTTACDGPPNKWVIGGRAGYYALLASHPDFDSSHDEFSDPNPIVINVPQTPGITDHNILNANPVPRLELKQTQLDISVTNDTPNPVGTPYYVLTRNGNPVSGPAVVDGTVEVSVTPGGDYRIEVRACTAAQIPVTDFEGCDARFPAIMPFSVPRSPAAAVDVVLPLLTVGSQINMTILFENAAGDPACPADPSVSVGRRFTGALAPGSVDGTDVDQDDTDLEDERTETQDNSANPVCGGTDGNEVSLNFAEMIPSGPSQFTLPTITGYSNQAPSVFIDPPGTTVTRYDPTVDVTQLSHAVTVTYVADNIDVTLNLCTGTSPANRDCTDEFHGLTADLDGITGTVGPRGPNGTPVTFNDVGPANNPRTLTITDLTHDNSVTPSVQVGSNQPSTQTVDFPGSKAVVAAVLTPDPNDAVVGVLPSTDVTTHSPCDLVDQGTTTSYARCFLIDTPGGADFDVDVAFPNTTIPDYMARSVAVDAVADGQTRIVPIALVQRATLSVAVQARDEDFGLDSGVDAVGDVTPHIALTSPGAASAPDTDLVPGTSNCTNGFCTLTYRVDPNVNYQFTVTGNTYEFDSTSIVFMTPGQQRNLGGQEGLELRPRVVTVPVDTNGLDVTNVELGFGANTFTSTTSTTSNDIETFRFSTLDAQPIPLTGDPDVVFVRVADGRNRAVANPTINGDVVQQVAVFDYASANGTFTGSVVGPVTVEATSGATTLTTTVPNSDIANGWTITGLDVDDDGSNRTWTFNVVGAAAGPTQSVDATTASYTITTPLGPAPRVIDVPVDTSGLGTGDSVTSATLTIGGTTYTSSDTTVGGNTTTVQFRSDSGVGAIPLTGTPTVALITVDGGRNHRDTSLNFSTSGNDPDDGDNPNSGTVYRGGNNPIQVYDYASANGDFHNTVVLPVTVRATSDNSDVIEATFTSGNGWSIAGLDNDTDGTDLGWTFQIIGGTNSASQNVNASTSNYNINTDLRPAPRTIDVPITSNGLDVTAVEVRIDGSNYDSSNYTDNAGTRTFHFSTESSLPNSDTIPFTDNPTRITVTVADGRNRRDSSPTFTIDTGADNPNSGTTNTIAVFGYATASGTVDSSLTGPVTVQAKSGGTTLTSSAIADPSTDNTWSISGLFNDNNGTDRTWTIKIVGAAGADEVDIDVDATTASYPNIGPLVDTS